MRGPEFFASARMPRMLTFRLAGNDYALVPSRIDRRRLYGWTGVVATDEQGAPCTLAGVDEQGNVIPARGGTALGLLSADGLWVERAQLRTLDSSGAPAPLLGSSFDEVIPLDERIDPARLLDYRITDLYRLDADAAFAQAVGEDVYTFAYSYHDTWQKSPAFILLGNPDQGERPPVFMLVGQQENFQPLSLASPLPADVDEPQDEEDELDFAMFR